MKGSIPSLFRDLEHVQLLIWGRRSLLYETLGIEITDDEKPSGLRDGPNTFGSFDSHVDRFHQLKTRLRQIRHEMDHRQREGQNIPEQLRHSFSQKEIGETLDDVERWMYVERFYRDKLCQFTNAIDQGDIETIRAILDEGTSLEKSAKLYDDTPGILERPLDSTKEDTALWMACKRCGTWKGHAGLLIFQYIVYLFVSTYNAPLTKRAPYTRENIRRLRLHDEQCELPSGGETKIIETILHVVCAPAHHSLACLKILTDERWSVTKHLVHVADDRTGKTAVHHALEINTNEGVEILKYLLQTCPVAQDGDEDSNEDNVYDQNPLFHHCMEASGEPFVGTKIECLLTYAPEGYYYKHPTSMETPLDVAFRCNAVEVARQIVACAHRRNELYKVFEEDNIEDVISCIPSDSDNKWGWLETAYYDYF